MEKQYKELYDLQWELNQKIGRDTIDSYNKRDWLYDYLQALSDEIVEAKNCISWKWWTKESKENGRFAEYIDPKNLKIEFVDMLHFLLSLDQICDFKFKEKECFVPYKLSLTTNDEIKSPWRTFQYLDLMLTYVQNLKAFSNFRNIDSISDIKIQFDITLWQNMLSNIRTLWQIFYTVSILQFGMTWNELYELYLKKNKVNLDRQDTDYSTYTKTEDDNNELKETL